MLIFWKILRTYEMNDLQCNSQKLTDSLLGIIKFVTFNLIFGIIIASLSKALLLFHLCS